jgi:hypothetical protein
VYITSLVNDVIRDLTPLQNLTYIEGMLTISENHALTSLNGLQNLRSANGIEISFNNTLSDLTGLRTLRTVKGSFIVLSNPMISNLSDFNHQLEISGDLTIKNNERLRLCNVTAVCNYVNSHDASTYLKVANNLGSCYNHATLTHACNTALPVILADFEVIREGQAALLHWSTSIEKQVHSFDIEHSRNGVVWRRAGTIRALGENRNLMGYTFRDYPSGSDEQLYRLKINDIDGSFAYSAVRHTSSAGSSLHLFPNPVADKLFIAGAGTAGRRRMEAWDSKGKMVWQTTGPFSPEIPVRNWENGLYTIRIWENDERPTNFRIIKNQ